MANKVWAIYEGLYDTLDEFRIQLKKATKEEASELRGCEWRFDVFKGTKIIYLNAVMGSKSLDEIYDKYSKKYVVNFTHKFRWGYYWEAGQLIIRRFNKLTTQKGPGLRGSLPERESLERIMKVLEEKGIVKKIK